MGIDCIGVLLQNTGNFRGGIPFKIVEINHFPVILGKRPEGFHHTVLFRCNRRRVGSDLIHGNGVFPGKTFQKIFAGICGDPDQPGFFVFRAFKFFIGKRVFEKYSLENVFCVSIVF